MEYDKILFVIIQIPLFILGAFIFLFAFWRRLKEDYFESHIFTSGFYILGVGTLMILIANFLAKDYWFWFAFIGILLGTLLGTIRFRLRFFEILEGTLVGVFVPVIFILLYDGISQKRPSSFFAIAVWGVFIGLYFFFSMHYKKFTWYKSGKVGFAGLSVLGLIFLCRALVAIWIPSMVSFVSIDWILSSIVSFVCFLALINLTLQKA